MQPAGIADRLWAVVCFVPVAGLLIAMLIFSRCKLRDKDVQIMTKANAGEITRAEASALLNGKYE